LRKHDAGLPSTQKSFVLNFAIQVLSQTTREPKPTAQTGGKSPLNLNLVAVIVGILLFVYEVGAIFK